MKTLTLNFFLLTCSLLLNSVLVKAQDEQLVLVPDYARYAVRIGEGFSPSGHGFNYGFDLSVERLKKSLYLGMFIDQADGKIAGLNLRYKHYLNQSVRRGLASAKGKFNPYLGYKFVYRMEDHVTAVPIALQTSTNKRLKSSATVTGRASSLEHMLGAGMQYHLNSRVILDGSAGIGYFIGDIAKEDKQNFLGISLTNSGFGLSAEMGLVIILFN